MTKLRSTVDFVGRSRMINVSRNRERRSLMVRRLQVVLLSIVCLSTASLSAQPLVKTVTQVDAGNTKQAGQTFRYVLTYNCSSTSGPCLNAEIDDLLPASVQIVSTTPTGAAGDIAAVNITPNFSAGRTRVQFVMNSPLTAGNSGDAIIDVRFPNGSTPDGTTATNTADGI